MNKRGFTLAEVLITLGIIGVIAAMTVPTLMNNSTEIEFRSAFKKGLAALNQAVTMNVALDNVDFDSLTNTGVGSTTSDSLYALLANRMSTAKFLDSNDASRDACLLNIGEVAGVGSASAKAADGGDGKGDGNVAMFFTDGSCIIWRQEYGVANKHPKASASPFRQGIRAIWDVNGSKKPNRLSWCDSKASSDGRKKDKIKKSLTDTNADTTCNDNNVVIRDQFSIILKGNRALPNGQAAHYLFYMK